MFFIHADNSRFLVTRNRFLPIRNILEVHSVLSTIMNNVVAHSTIKKNLKIWEIILCYNNANIKQI